MANTRACKAAAHIDEAHTLIYFIQPQISVGSICIFHYAQLPPHLPQRIARRLLETKSPPNRTFQICLCGICVFVSSIHHSNNSHPSSILAAVTVVVVRRCVGLARRVLLEFTIKSAYNDLSPNARVRAGLRYFGRGHTVLDVERIVHSTHAHQRQRAWTLEFNENACASACARIGAPAIKRKI